MYGGLLPATGGFLLNPLRVLYLLIALAVFGGGWLARKLGR
ncbi:hypothetical protein [Rubrobacter taiwanensis]|jgi:hypothetical protein|nr:hypothetical protein [Rubrobacter taiwanensis]